MAPMTRSRAIGNLPNDLMAEYYGQRAGAGLIITEGVAPAPEGLGYARIPGVFSEEQTKAWAKVAAAIHEKGGIVFMQLMHTGRVSHHSNLPAGKKVVGASAIAAAGDMWSDTEGLQPMDVPVALTTEEVSDVIKAYAVAARNAIAAGFDGVEIHGANGYLPEQFLNPHSNQRTDQYGGSVANRARFLLEVTAAVAKEIGKDRVGVRISPFSTYNDLPYYSETPETYLHLVQELHQIGIVYLHVVEYAARATDEGNQLLQDIRKTFPNTLIVNGGYTLERAEGAVSAGAAELISFGIPFIANPDLPFRFSNNIALAEPDHGNFYTAAATGYTDYPFAG